MYMCILNDLSMTRYLFLWISLTGLVTSDQQPRMLMAFSWNQCLIIFRCLMSNNVSLLFDPHSAINNNIFKNAIRKNNQCRVGCDFKLFHFGLHFLNIKLFTFKLTANLGERNIRGNRLDLMELYSTGSEDSISAPQYFKSSLFTS